MRIDQHLKLLAATADRDHLRHTANRPQSLPHNPVRLRAQFQRPGRAVRAPHADDHDLAEQRGLRSQLRPDAVGHPRLRDADPLLHGLPRDMLILAPVELDIDQRQPDVGRTANGNDARRTVELRFQRKRDQRFDFFRRVPGALGDENDTRPGEIGQHINRQTCRDQTAGDDDGQSHHHHRQAVVQRKSNDVVEHDSISLSPIMLAPLPRGSFIHRSGQGLQEA